MKRNTFFLFVILISAVGAAGQNLPDSVYTKVGFAVNFESELLDQTRKLLIHLPVNYNPETSYPLIVLLDGEIAFKSFAAATELLSWQEMIAPCIVVGICNVNRQEDYAPVIEGIPQSGKADTMAAFFREELLPWLETQYQIKYKILSGHSWVGFFSIYVMLSHPDLFNAHIATSPSFGFFDRVYERENLFDRVAGKDTRFYMSLGGDELVADQMKAFALLLESDAPESLQWKFRVKEDRDHDTNAIVGFMDGLEFILRQ